MASQSSRKCLSVVAALAFVAGCAVPRPAVTDGGGPSTAGQNADTVDAPQGAKGDEHMGGAAVEITDTNFVAVTARGVTLVDFWATWCPPCRMQGPIVDRLAGQYKGRATVGKLDVDSNQATAQQFGVSSIPTLILFKDGAEMHRMVGLQTEQKLQSVLDAAIAQ